MTLPLTESHTIPGPAGALEAELEAGPGTSLLALCCHPHPLHQGTMDNKVVTTLSRAFAREGAASLRFNFRGVGASGGAWDGGTGEFDDALAACRWLRARFDPDLPLILAGFSFGGAIAYRLAAAMQPDALVTVAPAWGRVPESAPPPACPWLLVFSRDDDVVPADGLERWAQRGEVAPSLRIFDNAGHYFHGRLPELRDAVREFLQNDGGLKCSKP